MLFFCLFLFGVNPDEPDEMLIPAVKLGALNPGRTYTAAKVATPASEVWCDDFAP